MPLSQPVRRSKTKTNHDMLTHFIAYRSSVGIVERPLTFDLCDPGLGLGLGFFPQALLFFPLLKNPIVDN